MADLFEALSRRRWGGECLSEDDIALIESGCGVRLPDWLRQALVGHELCGAYLTLDESEDESGLGVEMRWLDADGIVEEAVAFYPGLVALPLGYLPIGSCLEGSSDPYFVQLADSPGLSPVVRIPHEAVVDGDRLPLEALEVVATSIVRFLELASIEN